MGEVKPAEWYDKIYRTAEVHKRRGAASPWYPLWSWCADRIRFSDEVLELGCGMGGLMSLMWCQRYYGIDFSGAAVAVARRVARSQAYPATVRHAELPDAIDKAGRYSVLVACEVLEHLDDDLACLERAPSGTRILLTLPKNDSAAHVRHFPSATDIVERYGGLIDIARIEPIGERHFGIEGTRK